MGDKSTIEWTSATWNPLLGCTRVSEGCRHCYAERMAYRLESMKPTGPYRGTTKKVGHELRWTGQVNLHEAAVNLPLKWKGPRRIFVNSMSDLFHEAVREKDIERILAVMALAQHHTFQILTKRPERMLDMLTRGYAAAYLEDVAREYLDETTGDSSWQDIKGWPLPNVWLGVSVENQATADARIPLLLQTPAAVRWVSYEPALGQVDFSGNWLRCGKPAVHAHCNPHLNWIVVGGESGPGARPFDLAWARQTIAQGRAAGVPVFVKQLGARPFEFTLHDFPHDAKLGLSDRKGGDPAEWPEDLRVREYPT
jgi:protein gp37